jgi:uncharacterized protein (DUF4415 family)
MKKPPEPKNPKIVVTLHIEKDVLDRLKALPDWRETVRDALRKVVGL